MEGLRAAGTGRRGKYHTSTMNDDVGFLIRHMVPVVPLFLFAARGFLLAADASRD
jgi:hypothetical protein